MVSFQRVIVALIPVQRPRPETFRVVFAVISQSKGALWLPFFSRLSLRHAAVSASKLSDKSLCLGQDRGCGERYNGAVSRSHQERPFSSPEVKEPRQTHVRGWLAGTGSTTSAAASRYRPCGALDIFFWEEPPQRFIGQLGRGVDNARCRQASAKCRPRSAPAGSDPTRGHLPADHNQSGRRGRANHPSRLSDRLKRSPGYRGGSPPRLYMHPRAFSPLIGTVPWSSKPSRGWGSRRATTSSRRSSIALRSLNAA